MDYPWRSERDPWLALAAEVLLQRTRASQVVPVFEALRARYASPNRVAEASPRDIERLFAPLGLRWRARYFAEMGRYLSTLGRVPSAEKKLLLIPSVGPYAAAAYRSLHLDRRSVLIDANIVRWMGRMFGFRVDGETRRKRWLLDLADRLTPERHTRAYNYALLDLTMTVCSAKPRCESCPLSGCGCQYAGKHVPSNRPHSQRER